MQAKGNVSFDDPEDQTSTLEGEGQVLIVPEVSGDEEEVTSEMIEAERNRMEQAGELVTEEEIAAQKEEDERMVQEKKEEQKKRLRERVKQRRIQEDK